jgi:hypothetical protein
MFVNGHLATNIHLVTLKLNTLKKRVRKNCGIKYFKCRHSTREYNAIVFITKSEIITVKYFFNCCFKFFLSLFLNVQYFCIKKFIPTYTRKATREDMRYQSSINSVRLYKIP